MIERGSISGMQINCFDTATGVDATISFDISGSTGPASRSGQVVLEYFVSILDDEDVALEKQSYVASLSMNRGHGTTRKFHGIQIPFDMDGRIVKREVVIGLQLTREELSYNIHR